MSSNESIRDYYQRHGHDHSDAGQFRVYRIEEFNGAVSSPHTRRDFYKITLTTRADGILSYANQDIRIHDTALIFSNPLIPYSWERFSGSETGFFCLFTEEFVTRNFKTDSVAGSPLFRTGGHPVVFPDPATVRFLSGVFEQMLSEMESAYSNKYDLLRSYVQIILHESLKIASSKPFYESEGAFARISSLFLELLERQFPIASPRHTLQLKNANEFATRLMVHTNHLNKALKAATGKTTTEHISETIANEAKALLLHSNWTVTEIGYSLGFGHASNFVAFFRRQTGKTPNAFRKNKRAIPLGMD